jgi:hypothetical protein
MPWNRSVKECNREIGRLRAETEHRSPSLMVLEAQLATGDNNQAQIVRYLLGRLAGSNRTRFEARLAADDELLGLLDRVEEELVRDYLRGDLSWWDRRCFERRLRSSADLGIKTNAAQALMIALSTSSDMASLPAHARRARFWLPPFGPMSRFVLTSAILGLCALWLGWDDFQLRRQLTARRPENTSGVAAIQPVFSFILSPGLTRGDSRPRRMLLPETAARVRLRLELPGWATYRLYRATVRTTDGAYEVWSGDVSSSNGNQAGVSVDVEIPVETLVTADYVIVLRALTTQIEWQELASYSFGVVHPESKK